MSRPPHRVRARAKGTQMKHTRTSSSVFGLRRLILPLFVVAACAADAPAQARPPVAVEHVAFKEFPVELVGLESGGELHELVEKKPAQFAASFDAPDDWLQRVSFRIKNKTGKTVLTVVLTTALTTGRADETPMAYDLFYGQELDESAFSGRQPRGEPRRLAPGETADARWSAAEYEQLIKFLSTQRPAAAYRQVRVDLREVRFDDGTVWRMGRRYRVDPSDPRKWTPLDERGRGDTPPPELKPGERLVEVSVYMPDSGPEAVALVEIRVAGQTVTPGRPFFAAEDWLRGLTVRVRNTSTKPISSVQVNFSLPDADYQGGGVAFHLRRWRGAAGGEQPATELKPIPPGEEAELSFTDKEYESFVSFAKRLTGAVSFSRARVGMASVVFTDGTSAVAVNPAYALRPAAPGDTK